MIRATDRLAAVLARDERLIDEFAALSPAFERLRSPWMRKTMSRLVTVEQAARMVGLDAATLVGRLNRALAGITAPGADARAGAGMLDRPDERGRAENRAATGSAAAREPAADPQAAAHSPDEGGRSMNDRSTGAPAQAMGVPSALAALPAEQIVDVDVREALKRGEEPFSTIMAARRSLPPGGALRVRAIFEPVPLYAVMGKQGLEHWTERFAEDDWRVWFYPGAPAPHAPGVAGPEGFAASPAEEDVVILDVRGLEPPEPMVRTLEALEDLPAGRTLVQLNVRVPQRLLPQLEARGFTYEIREQSRNLVRVFIRRSDGH